MFKKLLLILSLTAVSTQSDLNAISFKGMRKDASAKLGKAKDFCWKTGKRKAATMLAFIGGIGLIYYLLKPINRFEKAKQDFTKAKQDLFKQLSIFDPSLNEDAKKKIFIELNGHWQKPDEKPLSSAVWATMNNNLMRTDTTQINKAKALCIARNNYFSRANEMNRLRPLKKK